MISDAIAQFLDPQKQLVVCVGDRVQLQCCFISSEPVASCWIYNRQQVWHILYPAPALCLKRTRVFLCVSWNVMSNVNMKPNCPVYFLKYQFVLVKTNVSFIILLMSPLLCLPYRSEMAFECCFVKLNHFHFEVCVSLSLGCVGWC